MDARTIVVSMQDLVFYIPIIFAAFGGFLLAFYIHHKKSKKEVMACPLDSNCETVIYSPHARFFGIPVEALGMLYYAGIAIGYAAFLVLPRLATPSALLFVFLSSAAALLFSLYLTFLQAFVIKEWCTWCLGSAALTTIIFALSIFGTSSSALALLGQYDSSIRAIYLLGVALGVGAATITFIFFSKFLKDFRISEWEAEILRTLSQVQWFALGMIVLSGIALYLPAVEQLNASATFLVRVIAVAVLIKSGALLNLFIAPKLVNISFGRTHDHETGELRHLRRSVFAFGIISLISWYAIFFLGVFRPPATSFLPLFVLYLLVLAIGVAISQMFDWLVRRRSSI